ncbi:hypothetical protein B0H14DRAFT_3491801 [Mycena olivaceomarginata]|nr:hypothetical protein B0H14DRAFT_3491801 [Mycena olivaceomarginata]
MPTATMHALPRATRPPTQPSANTTLEIESHAQLISFWRISFPFLIHHRRPALGISRRHAETIRRLVCTHQRSLHVDTRAATHRIRSGTRCSYSAERVLLPPGMTGFLNVEVGEPRQHALLCRHIRWLQGSLVVALVFIQRPDAEPASSMHRFPRDARLHRFRVCTPPMLTACIPIATFDVAGRVADHELYPLRLMIVLGGYDGRDFSYDTWCLNIYNATPWRTKQLIVWEPPMKMPRHAPCRRPMPPRVRCFYLASCRTTELKSRRDVLYMLECLDEMQTSYSGRSRSSSTHPTAPLYHDI